MAEFKNPAGRNKKTDPHETAVTVAAMVGAGLMDKQIANKIGISRQRVGKIRAEIVNDPKLIQVRDSARQRLADKAISLLDKTLDLMNESLDGIKVVTGKDKSTGLPIVEVVKPPLNHQASALRELTGLAGFRNPEVAPAAPGSPSSIPLTPEAIAALIQAAKDYQASLNQPRDITPEGERIE